MKRNALYLIAAAGVGLLLSACASMDSLKYRNFQVSADRPLWLSGVQEENLDFTATFPAKESSEHFQVINAGMWLARTRAGTIEPSLIYAFNLNVTKPFEQRVYTRAILENPATPNEPIQYQAPLDPEAGSSNITHGPVTGLVLGTEYHLVFEVYANEDYSQLLERIDQPIIAQADNSTGCIELSPEYLQVHFSRIPDMNNNSRQFVPIEYVQIYCDAR
ncbi:hypothetical protein [Saccharospirillum mangrovi]|uniref:hypothetical protein n=1 Tax=Saccharospirillum mangrovi TaxID=2161747 RepID=UPI000D3C017D|nr:hypothetical protein [Saccharospirillum mangrovi]